MHRLASRFNVLVLVNVGKRDAQISAVQREVHRTTVNVKETSDNVARSPVETAVWCPTSVPSLESATIIRPRVDVIPDTVSCYWIGVK
jgi:hypothetical protein